MLKLADSVNAAESVPDLAFTTCFTQLVGQNPHLPIAPSKPEGLRCQSMRCSAIRRWFRRRLSDRSASYSRALV